MKKIKIPKWKLVLIALAIVASVLFPNFWVITGAILCVIASLFIVIVPAGFSMWQSFLGKMIPVGYGPGIHLTVPFLCEYGFVDTKLQKHADEDKMKNFNKRETRLKFILNYQVNPKYVYLLHSTIGEDRFVTEALCPWLDAIFTSTIAQTTYDDINGKLAELSRQVTSLYKAFVDERCRELCKFDAKLFINIKVSILEVGFDADYEQAIADTAKAEKDQDVAKAKAKQAEIVAEANATVAKIKADADAEVKRKLAEAEAEALRLVGESENQVREKMGVILKEHPELLKKYLTDHFPKVISGGSTMINLDSILGESTGSGTGSGS